MLEFHLSGGLHMKKHTSHAGSLDSAVQASMEEIAQKLVMFEKQNEFHPNSLKLKIEELESDFACEPGNSFCPGTTKIVSIAKEGKSRNLMLRNRYDVEVSFDDQFRWLRTKDSPPNSRPKSNSIPFVVAPNK